MQHKTVLIVDDDEISLLVLQNAFELSDFNVIVTTDSSSVEQLFLQFKPEIVIFDIFMPNKDGFELLKELRSHTKQTILIAISASERYLSKIKALGATDAVLKTILPEDIVKLVQSY